MYGLCVVEMTLCRAFNACTVFSCFLHPSRGGAYTQEVYHENLRIYRPQPQGLGLPGIRWAVRQEDGAAAAVHAGLFEKAEPVHGRPCGDRTCGLERQAQWDGTDGVVCQRDREAGLDSPAGYLGNAIRKASLRWQRGFFFLMVREHLSVSFADSSP